eukprot:TRINITY_DN8447_c4_g1_i1.p1 TRINITY_DN8447_c4_g1~~TRINITY_DN8447_c4_g1_i1.p1  ORF type:complete len:206 (+),score=75.25 TRINITY_DN8447_c4_g1_i1:79-618(+)
MTSATSPAAEASTKLRPLLTLLSGDPEARQSWHRYKDLVRSEREKGLAELQHVQRQNAALRSAVRDARERQEGVRRKASGVLDGLSTLAESDSLGEALRQAEDRLRPDRDALRTDIVEMDPVEHMKRTLDSANSRLRMLGGALAEAEEDRARRRVQHAEALSFLRLDIGCARITAAMPQ